jgi:gamma-glutamylcyclotransferase (GGCT)/AIG2-like uncharacterized protein YtfP
VRRGRRSVSREAAAVLEDLFDRLFRAARRLAVYGSLAPGKEHHDVLAGLAGEWSDGYVRGDLSPDGWGATLGYPALRSSPDGARVPVRLFYSEALPAHWPRIDAFEGPQYVRTLIPVYRDDAIIAVANIYEAREWSA